MNKTKCSEENDCQYFALPQFRAARLMANQKHTNFDYKTQGGDAALKSHNFSLSTCSLNVIIGRRNTTIVKLAFVFLFLLFYISLLLKMLKPTTTLLFVQRVLLCYWNCYFPMNPVGWFVGRSVTIS